MSRAKNVIPTVVPRNREKEEFLEQFNDWVKNINPDVANSSLSLEKGDRDTETVNDKTAEQSKTSGSEEKRNFLEAEHERKRREVQEESPPCKVMKKEDSLTMNLLQEIQDLKTENQELRRNNELLREENDRLKGEKKKPAKHDTDSETLSDIFPIFD